MGFHYLFSVCISEQIANGKKNKAMHSILNSDPLVHLIKYIIGKLFLILTILI